MPEVSVIVPVYNVEPYVARCARSLFGQTLGDMEFIFVDDFSSDRSIEIIRLVLDEFPSRKSQARFFRMPENSGQAIVRMKGMELATGDFVIHCDADDCVVADAYETMYRKAVSEGLDIVTCDFNIGDDDSSWKHLSLGSLPGKELSDILAGRIMGSLCNRLVRRSLLDGLIPPVGNMAEDTVLAVQIICKARTMAHISKPLYYYCRRPDSISNSTGMNSALRRWESLSANVGLIVEILERDYGFEDRSSDIVYAKYRSRNYLLPYIDKPDIYRKWRSTFPEVDGQILTTKGIPWSVKFWFVLIHLKIYHPWKAVTNRLFRRSDRA